MSASDNVTMMNITSKFKLKAVEVADQIGKEIFWRISLLPLDKGVTYDEEVMEREQVIDAEQVVDEEQVIDNEQLLTRNMTICPSRG